AACSARSAPTSTRASAATRPAATARGSRRRRICSCRRSAPRRLPHWSDRRPTARTRRGPVILSAAKDQARPAQAPAPQKLDLARFKHLLGEAEGGNGVEE